MLVAVTDTTKDLQLLVCNLSNDLTATTRQGVLVWSLYQRLSPSDRFISGNSAMTVVSLARVLTLAAFLSVAGLLLLTLPARVLLVHSGDCLLTYCCRRAVIDSFVGSTQCRITWARHGL